MASEDPHPTDIHVGARVRYRRNELGISQLELATRLGLTFQQIQKYERGKNRISASKLHEISQVLGVELGYFFNGLDVNTSSDAALPDVAVSRLIMVPEGAEIAAKFPKLSGPKLRSVLAIVRLLTDEDESASDKDEG